MKLASILLFTLLISTSVAQEINWPKQLVPVGHSHNDYKHIQPLFDALEYGYCSIEVDVYLKNGRLLVAHTALGLRKGNTLERLYLEPLSEIINENGGTVYLGNPIELMLMIDIKRGSKALHDSLNTLLSKYADILTVYENGIKKPGAVRVLLSGSRDVNFVKQQNPRYMSIDGGMGDLDEPIDTSLVIRVSNNYKSQFKWNGKGTMPEAELIKLREIVAKAKQQGLNTRFYALPHRKKLWQVFLDEGVSWVNVDKLKKFRGFYFEWAGRK